MTGKLTREQVIALIAEYSYDSALVDALEYLLAAIDSEPVAYAVSNDFWNHGNHKQHIDGKQCDVFFPGDTYRDEKIDPEDFDHAFPLYRHAQQPVVPGDGRADFEAWVVECHKGDIAKAQFPDGEDYANAHTRCVWKAWTASRAAMLQAGNNEIGSWSNGKNTPTVTSITPAAPDKKLTDDVLDEIIAGAKTSMEQYLALSLKAERKVWRQECPTDDERIMAIEGMIKCLLCGGNGWVVGEMGITRCACGQAGNSPVIPDGYVMVPKEPTERMVIDGFESEPDEAFSEPEVWEAYQEMSGCEQAAYRARLCWAAMLAATPQEVRPLRKK